MKKKLLLLISFIFIFGVLNFFVADSAKALAPAPKSLEVQYIPSAVPGVVAPTTTATKLPEYVKYIYFFTLGIGGIIALGVIIAAGFIYLTSTGMPDKISDAKDRIKYAVLGLLILFASGLILKTINPGILLFPEIGNLPPILPNISPGVWLCKSDVPIAQFWSRRKAAEIAPSTQADADTLNNYYDQIQASCMMAIDGNLSDAYDDKVTMVYLVPSEHNQYGAILFDETDFKINEQSKGSAFYGDGTGGVAWANQPTSWPVSSIKASSVKTFILNYSPPPSSYVALYKYRDQNRGATASSNQGGSSIGFPSPEIIRFQGNVPETIKNLPTNAEIGSLGIEGKILVFFFKTSGDIGNWSDGMEFDLYTESNNNLLDNLMGVWNPACNKPKPGFNPPIEDYACAGGVVIVSIL